MNLGPIADTVHAYLGRLDQGDLISRIWDLDPTVWTNDPDAPEVANRLGWLSLPETMLASVDELTRFSDEVRAKFDRVVLCGMGGSSLGPEVLWRSFGKRDGYPSLHVLDSTDPRAVADVGASELDRTLFLVASKSGTTIETLSFQEYFWEQTGGNGSQFVAITDPGSTLAATAEKRAYRNIFLNPPDVGGRFSALSLFGLVPAALIGIDIRGLLAAAATSSRELKNPAAENPGALLGAFMAAGATEARDKLTLILSPTVASLGLWVEQLVAESTGKLGKGVVPVLGEPLLDAGAYSSDRAFVVREAKGDPLDADALDALAEQGFPVLRGELNTLLALGGEFLTFEFATAVTGALLGVNPFDQPNVAESKANTSKALESDSEPMVADAPPDVRRWLEEVRSGDYVALLAYVAPTKETDEQLAALQQQLRERLEVAVTVGYGPRYLHSTGQLHKGGPATGHFVQMVDWAARDVPIPGRPYGFGRLIAAQADGDLIALRTRGRPAIRIDRWDALQREI